MDSPVPRDALARGYERVSAWARLLDRINVFPVPDGDTGRNLVVSLAPLRNPELAGEPLIRSLLMSARGNSGNIGVRFMEGLLDPAANGALAPRVRRGRDLARGAVADPRPGTMLSLFDALADAVDPADEDEPMAPDRVGGLLDRLEQEVRDTTGKLPELREAGVVDAGALGMFLFFDGFFCALAGRPGEVRDVARSFPAMVGYDPGRLAARAGDGEDHHDYCVDAVLRSEGLDQRALDELRGLGDSAVTLCRGELLKVHLHTADQEGLRRELERLGGGAAVLRWSSDDLGEQQRRFVRPQPRQVIHLMTDAAGSVTRELAEELGFSLLDSYITVEDLSLPETYLEPAEMYRAMRRGVRVSTSQASDYERHQHYARVLSLHRRVLYLCVGSVFTGNHGIAARWLRENDPDGRMVLLDSGAASGKLGICARAVARLALTAQDPQQVVDFARAAQERAREYIFLDRLHYLAAGGRLSKGSAFFGDLLHIKPIVTPTRQGAQKIGTARNFKDQLAFAVAHLQEDLSGGRGMILLEHSDNEQLVRQEVLPELEGRFPGAEILCAPLSLTSGAHMGPGTWAVAVLPNPDL